MPSHWPTSAKEYAAREQAVLDALPLVSRCALCGWSWEGDTATAREKASQHRLQAHPEIARKRSQMRRVSKGFRQPGLKDWEREEIESERRKRAFITGVDLVD